MGDIGAWIADQGGMRSFISGTDLAYDTQMVIQDKPTTITVKRLGTEQIVRLEPLQVRALEQLGMVADEDNLPMLVVGYKGHPSIADTDLRRGDRFTDDDGQMYSVINVVAGMDYRLFAVAEVSR